MNHKTLRNTPAPQFAMKPLALCIAALFALPSLAAPPAANALPEGGRISAGQASISQSGNRMDITQGSNRTVLDWNSFNIGSNARVDFIQPNASASALNRVSTGDASRIYGQLNANGQVWLINPAGVVFGAGSKVDVGGLVASTLDTLNSDFMNGKAEFKGSGGNVLNQGNLHAKDGGTIALIGNQSINEGVISAKLGNVVLAAGNKVTLNNGADGRLQVAVDPATLNTLVENRQLIQADGGQILMTSSAAGQLRSAVVSNSGTLQARTIANHQGKILLLSDMQQGQTNVGGTLDASAPQGGDGGFIETSGAKVNIASNAHITTNTNNGKTGTWLVDPQDFTIAASGGDMTGLALSTQLDSTNVTLQSSSGATAGSGDLNVNDSVSWGANNTLTLQAERNVNINANITATGDTAGLTLTPAGAGTYNLNNGAQINLSGATPSLNIAGTTYTVINDVNALQAMNGDLAGNYALGSNIDASATAGWNSGAGFVPVGAGFVSPGLSLTYASFPDNSFHGVFDGFNHTITGLDSVVTRYGATRRDSEFAQQQGMTKAVSCNA